MKYLIFVLLGVAALWYASTFFSFLAPFSPSVATSSPQKLAYVVPPVPVAPALKPSRTPPQGHKEYRSEFYKFQMFYPQNFSITPRDEGGSATTLRFSSSDKEFQIFIVPYGAPQISEARFKQDNPSGVMLDTKTISIGNTQAEAFVSKDASFGETYEIWFVAKGFLYEITSRKELGPWLTEILTSWEFL